MKKLFLIGGTMGVGKTSVCKELSNVLSNSVFLDGDWCWNTNPVIVNEETKKMVIDNICYLLNNYIKCSIYSNIIFCWVMHEQSIINEIIGNIQLDNINLKCISLLANNDTITKRLNQDILNGKRSEDVIIRSIQRIPLYNNLNTIKIDTDNKTVNEIVNEIISL